MSKARKLEYSLAWVQRQFQRAYAEFDDAELRLFAFAVDELPEHVRADLLCSGFVPTAESEVGGPRPGWMIYAFPVEKNPARNVRRVEAFELFQRLARHAGALLPVAEKRTLPAEPSDAASWWLSWIWFRHFKPLDGWSKTKKRILLGDAFKESADAIEDLRAGLGAGGIKIERGMIATIAGYRSADWFAHEHGIPQARLSEAAGDGTVGTTQAPKGMLDSQGRKVRLLYHEQQALKACSPKHVHLSTRNKLSAAGSNSVTGYKARRKSPPIHRKAT